MVHFSASDGSGAGSPGPNANDPYGLTHSRAKPLSAADVDLTDALQTGRFCSEKILDLVSAMEKSSGGRGARVTFLCGKGGALALSAVAHSFKQEWEKVLDKMDKLCRLTPVLSEHEVLYGRAGYLSALVFVQTNLAKVTSLYNPVVDSAVKKRISAKLAEIETAAALVIKQLADSGILENYKSFRWHDKCYLGAAHGLCGIIYCLSTFSDDFLGSASEQKISHRKLRELARRIIEEQVNTVLQNMPSSLGSSSLPKLVHWCHGAPGWALLCERFASFDKVLSNKPSDVGFFRKMADDFAETVWRKGLLHKKGLGLCHSASGNGYVFLSQYTNRRANGESGPEVEKLRNRAFHFAAWIEDCWSQLFENADRPYSLYEGMAGAALFLHECAWLAELEAGSFSEKSSKRGQSGAEAVVVPRLGFPGWEMD